MINTFANNLYLNIVWPEKKRKLYKFKNYHTFFSTILISDEPLDSDLEQDEENVIVDEPRENDLEQDFEQDLDHEEEEYYDLDQDNENEKIGVKEDQDDFEDCEENVIQVNHHESEFEVLA